MTNSIQPTTPNVLDALAPDWRDWLDLRVDAGEIAANTAAAYKRGMSKFADFLGGDASLHSDVFAFSDIIRQWKAALLPTYKDRTVNAWLAGVKSFFAWAVEAHRLPYNPAANIKGASRKGKTRKHIKDVLTDAEVRRVLAMPDDSV